MTNAKKIKEYLDIEDADTILRAMFRLNPMNLSASKVCTIKELSEKTGVELKRTWELVDTGRKLGLITCYGGILSRKRVDLTELGAVLVQCNTDKEIDEVLKNVN